MSPTTKRVTKHPGKSSKSKKSKGFKDPLGYGDHGPTKYDPKYCRMIIENARKPEGTFTKFAMKINVSVDTLLEWAKTHKEFSVAKSRAKKINEQAMFELGMEGVRGKLPKGAWQNAWIFAMKAKHGWREEVFDDDEDDDLEFDFE